jgi:hypothetical protein
MSETRALCPSSRNRQRLRAGRQDTCNTSNHMMLALTFALLLLALQAPKARLCQLQEDCEVENELAQTDKALPKPSDLS